ncbi:EcsC family protein [Actinomycetospora lemnae]|uniref:EcsC family protein n=1 Tax=Actinomycetospora lemnae TaxID=3019891 RepID=A0ABT5T037_9PSEU|nr:EcsC family protein [Actinomycetospora sp. DW7H6]MDD7968486.1 EcsC family protein [Actinomycetospora sp. DW7H6]
MSATTDDVPRPTPDVSPADAERWREVVQWKDRELQRPSGLFSPVVHGIAGIRSEVTSLLRRVPGVSQVDESVQGVLHQLAAAGAGAGAATLRRDAVFADFREHGHDVTDFKHIRRLDIADVETVMPRLDLGYTVFAGVQGGVTGFLTSTGVTAAAGGTTGAGLGSIPGIAVMVATLTGDTLLTVASCTRAVAHVAAYHGYDGTKRSEQIIALAVLSVGLSSDEDSPAAYQELAELIHAKTEENQKRKQQQAQIKRLGHAVYQRLLGQIGQREIAQLVPVLGIGVGAVLSARLLAKVVDTAEHLYRERFLHDKYELPFGVDLPFDPATYQPYVDGEADDGGDDMDDEGDEIFAGA